MNFSRRPVSASLGSWCLQLVYKPRSNDDSSAVAPGEMAAGATAFRLQRALLPAFMAIFIASGAACYALAHFIGLPIAWRALTLALGLVTFVAWGARCGVPSLSRICLAMRWPLAILLAAFTLSLRWSAEFAALMKGEPNMQAAIFCGFILLLSILLIGARSGGRLVPVAAPLVPALSLLGLLCLVAVDGITQACFLLFCAAALYVKCYDYFLRVAAPDLSSGVWNTAPRARRVARGDAPAWALQSVLVSSVWFALFLGGGALLFWPLQAFFPKIAAPRWNREQGANGERQLDYSGVANVMELRGGTHALSNRVLLRVTPIYGRQTGLWRGRVYELYDRSLWSERVPTQKTDDENQPLTRSMIRLVRPRPLGVWRASLPQLAPRQGHVESISELVEPLGGVADVVYSSGLPLKWDDRADLFNSNDPARTGDLTRSQAPYVAHSFTVAPNLTVLDATRGFDPNADNSKMAPDLRRNLRLNLQLPSEKSTRAVLKSVASQIEAGRLPTRTPSEKARAVADYLRRNCIYSLQAPAVPPTSDATVFFLTEAHDGACDMFASSATLLLREMGVPARVATGFLDPQNSESSAEINGKTVTVLRERDAHAWVEYYVPTYGWLSFDPTQDTREAPLTLAGKLAALFDLSNLKIAPVLLLLPLASCVLLVVGLLWQRRDESHARTDENERQIIEAAYAKALRLLRRRAAHAPAFTPGEYETCVLQSDVPAAAKQEFAALTHLYLAAHYGPTPRANREQIEACLLRLKSALQRSDKS